LEAISAAMAAATAPERRPATKQKAADTAAFFIQRCARRG